MRYFKKIALLIFCICIIKVAGALEKLSIVIPGLSHDHVNRILEKHNNGEIIIKAIAEANTSLLNKKKIKLQQ